MPTPARRASRALASVAVALALSAAAVGSEQSGLPDPVRDQATAVFRAGNPNIRFYTNPDGMLTVYGEPFSYGKSPQDAAAGFLARHARMFGIGHEELMPQSLLEDKRHTQTLGYDRETGTYKHTLVYYTQFKDGFPVYNAELRLLVGNTADFPVINAKSTIRDLRGFHVPADATKHLIDFRLARGAAVAAFPEARLSHFGKAELVVWGGMGGQPFLPALCYVFEAHSADHVTPDFASRRFLVDALTLNKDGSARVVHSEDLVHHVDVTGTVAGMGTANSNAAACSSLTSLPLPYARLLVGGLPYDADINGNFTIPNAGTTPVTVEASVRGKWFRVFESAGTTETQSVPVTPGSPQNFLFNSSLSEFTTAEVNAYIAANQARDLVVRYNPSFPTVSTAQEFTVNVQVSGTCNAFYSGNTINFYPAGGGCNNTAFGTVVQHEFGHNIVAKAGSGQGAYGEGYGDCMGILYTDNPVTGIGFSSCAGGIRTGNNNVQYPCTGEIHACGTLLSGCVWSLRNQLIVSDPSTYRDILGNLVIDSVLRHTGSSIDPSVTIDFLESDDNDNNINNGTPHYNQINAAFSAHNMPAPALIYLNFTYPGGRPATILPATPTSFNVSVSANIDAPQPGTGVLYFSTGSGFVAAPMTQTSANNYVATLPAVSCGTTVSYYVAARNAANALITDPPNAPSAVFTPPVGQGRLVDDFNTAQGWAVVNTPSGAGTFAGAWERAAPTGAGQRNDPAADADGSGFCFVTQNGGPGSNTDVDNGTTVLTSPVINAAGGPVFISYSRWFNTTGNTQDDPFVVDISQDNGVNWTNLETVGPTGDGTSGGWVGRTFSLPSATSQFKIRFTVSDVGTASLVEAAVDGVSILVCQNTCPADFDQTGVVNPADVSAFVAAWFNGFDSGNLIADFDGNGFLQPADVSNFVTAWFNAVSNGC